MKKIIDIKITINDGGTGEIELDEIKKKLALEYTRGHDASQDGNEYEFLVTKYEGQ